MICYKLILNDLIKRTNGPILKKSGIVLLVLCILFGMSGCFSQNSITTEDIENAGYIVTEADNGNFYITDNGAEYYFYNSNGKLTFDKVIIKIPAISEKAQAKGLEADITIIRGKGKKITVNYHYPAVDTNINGEEKINYFTMYFELKNDFEVESITNNRGFADIKGKYDSFTSNCLSSDDLNTYYQRGFELEEELNAISN